ncbi:MAG: hypothetical protein AB7L71_02410 [Vicinamibacterales bacterium]
MNDLHAGTRTEGAQSAAAPARVRPVLSALMRHALAYTHQHGSALVRRHGGFWVHPQQGDHRPGVEFVGPATVYALETRGLVEIQWVRGGARACLTQAGIDAAVAQLGAGR